MTDTTDDFTIEDAEPVTDQEPIWKRILYAVVLLILFAIAETVLWVLTALQIIWVPLTGGPNKAIADFGKTLADWTRNAVAYLTGAAADKPFPWADTNS
ncbi:DUF4389 domain-containing protein [Pseudoprimorskyibacter insulae]|uniref:Lipase n=1 Tax=Pseudoprimorskyibacter insulae TaxID=1695997 RepID=A0A2R8AYT7_9RHOB|nr:DUF4389 domain-containing protein [Pseudoprimorskyibacter insulae]SPF81029.1 hypothetical protein PRI8871_02846 [Pseudoprimorskyibacter insulae]